MNPVYAHNFHIHGATFRVLDVAGKQLEPAQRGSKDTVYLPPKSTARLAVAFGRYVDPTHPYMYHCHILRHEDAGMMGQYIVVTPGSEQLVDRQLPHRSEHQH